jgi:hypothetical protein
MTGALEQPPLSSPPTEQTAALGAISASSSARIDGLIWLGCEHRRELAWPREWRRFEMLEWAVRPLACDKINRHDLTAIQKVEE